MKKSFEFSYCLGEVEYIEDIEGDTTQTEGEVIVKTLIRNNKISIGERTKGIISYDSSIQPTVYDLDYEYCTEVGMDWGDDQWVEVQEQVQL